MLLAPNMDMGRSARRLRVETLVRLRWLAVAGQTAAVLTCAYGLGFPLPLGLCLAVIAASAWLNLGLRWFYPQTQRLDDARATLLLGYDVLQLSVLLFLTGGLENPFAMLFLAPVMISAGSLSPRRTLLLGLITAIAATFLAFWHQPLPWFAGHTLDLPFLYGAGVWISLIVGICFFGIYAWRVAEEARQLSDALAATELVLAREQHLSQLDGLAAAAAHELGTPLATITLVVKEMAKLIPREGALGEDIALLGQEVARCRTILGKLKSLDAEGEGPLEEMTLSHLIEDVVGPPADAPVPVEIARNGAGQEPVCRRNPGMLYGLGNLVENGLDFARNALRIELGWTQDRVSVVIEDDGPGFPPEILAKLGDPYITTRGASRRAKSEEGSGLGLGLFIAKTLLERSGAAMTTANRPGPNHGARISIVWPRPAFEHGRASPLIPNRAAVSGVTA
jgi:two-component system, sensor histidine kinase RegB